MVRAMPFFFSFDVFFFGVFVWKNKAISTNQQQCGALLDITTHTHTHTAIPIRAVFFCCLLRKCLLHNALHFSIWLLFLTSTRTPHTRTVARTSSQFLFRQMPQHTTSRAFDSISRVVLLCSGIRIPSQQCNGESNFQLTIYF